MRRGPQTLQSALNAILPPYKLRNLGWFSLPVGVPTGATVTTCALLSGIPAGVTLHRMVSPLTRSDYALSRIGADAIVKKCERLPKLGDPFASTGGLRFVVRHCIYADGTSTGIFPSTTTEFAEARGVSHFIILDDGATGRFHKQLAATAVAALPVSEPGFGRLPCQSLDGPVDLGAAGLAWCVDKAWGVAWPPATPRAVVLHALVFPAIDMPLRTFESLFPAGGGGPSNPALPYKPCAALPAALEAHLAPRPYTPTPGWTHAVADDGVPLRDSEHAGQVVRVLADALRRGAALPGLLSPSDAALALLVRHHFCVDLDSGDRPLMDEDDVALSDKLALVAHTCLQALPPDLYSDYFGYWTARKSLEAEMEAAVQARY